MPNYQNSKIYTIRCKTDDSLIYVGSTIQPLSKRMVEHRSKHNKENNENFTKPLYIKMREINVFIRHAIEGSLIWHSGHLPQFLKRGR